MRQLFSLLLVISIVSTAGYVYYTTTQVCPVPISYRIGSIDERFNLTEREVRGVLSDVEALWEDTTGRELFEYAPGGDLVVHFIYDERQELTNQAMEFEEILEQKKDLSQELSAQYNARIDEYEARAAEYETLIAEYEATRAEYRAKVTRWNERGGAPPDVYEALNREQAWLAEQADNLESTAREINMLVREINDIGRAGSEGLEDYNQVVDEYNERFAIDREFTQGDYQHPGIIHIYQFSDDLELRTVLAHEFGHALSLGHVEGPESIMYPLMEGQRDDLTLTEQDLAEFRAVCGID